jgi:predicted TIM-barrel fold metal-dependent hydrolase
MAGVTSQPSLNIFDCNASLGRRHNERVPYDSKEDLLRVMSEAGISRALVYSPYAAAFSTMEGNRFLLQQIGREPKLVPQFVVTFATDELKEVEDLAHRSNVRTLRVFPTSHFYPLVYWIADPWLEWMAAERLALWVPLGWSPEVDVRDLYETARRHPKVPIVLAGFHYSNYSVIWPLLKALDHVYVDLSRFDIPNGIERLKRHIGVSRLLFGSSFPDVDPKPYLYYLRHCGLPHSELSAICSSNLERLLSGDA